MKSKWKELESDRWVCFVGQFACELTLECNRYIARFFSRKMYLDGKTADCLHAWHCFDFRQACFSAEYDLREYHQRLQQSKKIAIVAKQVARVNEAILAGEIIEAVELYESILKSISKASNNKLLHDVLRESVIDSGIECLCEERFLESL